MEDKGFSSRLAANAPLTLPRGQVLNQHCPKRQLVLRSRDSPGALRAGVRGPVRSLVPAFLIPAVVLVSTAVTPVAQAQAHVQVWLTDSDRSQLVARQSPEPAIQASDAQPKTITVDDRQVLQTVDGFGFAMTGGSAQLLHHMDPAQRHRVLQGIFGRGPDEAGVSYLRVSIGSSDMNDHVFTYDEVPAGQTDSALAHFTLREDEADLIPVLKEVLQIAPGMQILASPWSAPSWMKTNGAPKGGSLRPEFYPVYAAYLVRYLQAMQRESVPIAAITMQNEPLNANNTPSLLMQPEEQEAFLRDSFGPALRAAGLKTRVVLYDHNCDRPDYPLTILKDPRAREFADGSGFHLYGGEITAMSQVHDAFPEKNLYFTEQMVVELSRDGKLMPVAYPVSRIVIGAMRNWSRTVLLWNLAADPQFGPHTSNGGCPMCQGAITVDGNNVTRNIAFFAIEHASRFVPPGSVRLGSTEPDPQLANVAWRTPQGRHVLLVTNTGAEARNFTVGFASGQFSAALQPGSVGTFVWRASSW